MVSSRYRDLKRCINTSSKCFSRVKEWLRSGRPNPLRMSSACVGNVGDLPFMLPVIGSQLSNNGDGLFGLLGVDFLGLDLTLVSLDWVSDVLGFLW